MKEMLQKLREASVDAILQADDITALENLRVKYLGKKGELTAILKQMGRLSAEERPAMGQLANQVRAELETALEQRREALNARMLEMRLKAEALDVTMPGKAPELGHQHPMYIVLDEIKDIFVGMGFEILEGPEIEEAEYNFTKLNTSEGHPAREWSDTFYQRVLCSPINVGSGQVRCAHGVLPVPAPATERLLRGVPVYAGGVTGELCTPTGAALLRQFVSDYSAMPQMCVSAAGYGTGKKDFAAANVVRVLLGESGNGDEQVVELCCNIDDQPAESLAFAMDELLALGALDVYFTAIGMKKGRPGVLLTCLCRPEQRDAMLRCIFRNTTTLGVRERTCARYSLARCTQTVQTRFGPVRVKTAQGYGVTREKAEYDDLARLARGSGQPLDEIRAAVAQVLGDQNETE